MTIRIVLADDHKIFREGIRQLFDLQEDMQLLGEAADGRTAVQLFGDLSPDVVIMDVTMPGLNGIDATRRIIAADPGAKVVALSMHSERRFAIEILKAGAKGYLLKDCAFDELVRAIHAVVAGHIYLCPEMTEGVLGDSLHTLDAGEALESSPLTLREREVLQLFAEGKSTKEIAQLLHVSPKTIETHRSQVMKKLNLNNLVELTKYAIREGMTDLS